MTQARKYAYLLLSLLASLTLPAQRGTLTGTVTDQANGEPLIAANIVAGATGGLTDLDGRYRIELTPGEYAVTISYVGYTSITEQITIRANETTELNASLTESATLLQTATVTSGKYEKPLGEVTVSLEVLKPDLIENTGKTTIDEALQKVPGVTIIDGQANIRGGSGYSQGAGSRVLLLMDDVPILQADAGFPNWDDVPLEVIEQVEVVKGAASALYGSSALNGIVNVRTAYAKNEPITKGSVFYTNQFAPEDDRLKWWDSAPNTFGASLSHRRKVGRLDLVMGAYYLNEDSYRKDTYRRFGRFNFNVRHRVTDRLSYGLAGNLNAGESGSWFYWLTDTAAYVGNPTTLSTRKRFRYNLDPFLTYYDGAGNRHKLLGRFYDVDNDNDRNQSNASQTYYAEYQFQRRFPATELVLTAGLVGSGTWVSAELYGDTTFNSRNYAGYLQLEKEFFDRLNLSAGMRYEYNVLNNPGFTYEKGTVPPSADRDSRPVFRFGLNYRAAEATYIRTSWGQGYRYPTIAERYIFTDFGGLFIEPSPNVGSETGWSAEVGIKQGYRLGSFEGFLDIAGFYMRYSDMIEFNWTGSGFQSLNIGGTEISGWEVVLAGRGTVLGLPFQLLTGYLSINPQFTEFDLNAPEGSQARRNAVNSSSSENVLKYRFRNTFKLDAEISIGGLRLGAETFYNSGIEAVDRLFQIFIPGLKRFQDANPDGFWYHNVRAAYVVNKHLRVSMILGNVFNKLYTLRPALPEPPRNLTARVDFNF